MFGSSSNLIDHGYGGITLASDGNSDGGMCLGSSRKRDLDNGFAKSVEGVVREHNARSGYLEEMVGGRRHASGVAWLQEQRRKSFRFPLRGSASPLLHLQPQEAACVDRVVQVVVGIYEIRRLRADAFVDFDGSPKHQIGASLDDVVEVVAAAVDVEA
jgi:hypothetical protein